MTPLLPLLLLCLVSLCQAKEISTEYVIVNTMPEGVIPPSSPTPLKKQFTGVTATFGKPFAHSPSRVVSAVVALPPHSPEACNLEAPPAGWPPEPWVLLARRGNCTFVAKAALAQGAGASGLVVYNQIDAAVARPSYNASDPDDAAAADGVEVYVVGLPHRDGMLIAEAVRGGQAVRLEMHRYVRDTLDASVFMLWAVAVGTVVAGAYWSSVKERREARGAGAGPGGAGSSGADGEDGADASDEEVAYLSERAAYCFVVVASCGLLVLFFFVSVLIYVLIVLFALGGSQGLYSLLASPARRLMPLSWRRPRYCVPHLGTYSVLNLTVAAPCVAFAAVWAVRRNEPDAWIMQDVLAVALLLLIQRTLRLPNVKVSSILLTLAFFYDIFWVFLSPYIFQRSVMITVATGGDSGEAIPMVIKMPRFGDELGGYSLLGLGDVALPGLLVSFLMRFDCEKRRSGLDGYFVISAAGYAAGVAITDAVLVATGAGQPALLYIVPCTLGVTVAVAWRRGHLAEMWRETKRSSDGLLPADDDSGGTYLEVTTEDVSSHQFSDDGL